MVNIKEYLMTALIVLCLFCTGYVFIILPIIACTPEFTENNLRMIMSGSLFGLLVYWALVLLLLGILIIEENIDIWNEMKKDWEKKRSPLTRICEDEPATCGFERKMTALNHKTTKEENDDK